ncbi:WW domain-containing oxidoreductase-like [Pseudonaja textilis]|uniref:WW domain-containing oxidoreductase-like n=1 Tax=Pseudonaja textilis TaxID=8673 RepID=UPI000EAAAE68|nr:WW domain-containing oxidoreductase-like [Pseudonaja textilis]
MLYWLCSPFMRSPQKGATSTLYCAVSPEVEGISGKYFDSNCTLVLPQALAQDPDLGQRLWEALEKATGLKTDGSQQAVSGPLPRGRLGASPSFLAGGAEKLLLSNADL